MTRSLSRTLARPIPLAMRRAEDAESAAAQGIAIARETVTAIRGMVQGVHIAAPGGRIEAALAVLDGIAASA